MASRAAWPRGAAFIALGILAVLSLLSGFDRHAARTGIPNRYLPVTTPGNAGAIARQMMADGRIDAAWPFARSALASDPLQPGTASLIAAAAFANGDAVRGRFAMDQAARLGWRDPAANAYWLQQAIDNQAYQEALLRFDVLYRSNRTGVRADRLLDYMDSTPRGREAILTYLGSATPDWAAWYWGRAADHELARERAAAAMDGDYDFECANVLMPAEGAFRNGWRRNAERLLQRYCGRVAIASPIADPGFRKLAGEGDRAFTWTVHRKGDVTLRFGENGLTARNRSTAQRLVLSQPVDLPQGRYELRTQPEQALRGIALSLDCGTQPARPSRDARTAMIAECERQILGLWLAPGAEVQLEQVALQPVAR